MPAPPEVAMRMMREQGGGPAAFDTSNGGPPAIGGGGVGGRKAGMLGVPPVIGGSAPLIAIPPAFQHDPRRIRRSYTPSPSLHFTIHANAYLCACADLFVSFVVYVCVCIY